jgi:hypothetical protein
MRSKRVSFAAVHSGMAPHVMKLVNLIKNFIPDGKSVSEER